MSERSPRLNSITPDSLAALRDRVRGGVLAPQDPGYAMACSAWNLSVRQQPAVITLPANMHEVAEAVRFARAHNLGVAVQATGHGLARPANDALLILTRNLAGVTVDPASQTARIEAGVRWGSVIRPAQNRQGSRHSSARRLASGRSVSRSAAGWAGCRVSTDWAPIRSSASRLSPHRARPFLSAKPNIRICSGRCAAAAAPITPSSPR